MKFFFHFQIDVVSGGRGGDYGEHTAKSIAARDAVK